MMCTFFYETIRRRGAFFFRISWTKNRVKASSCPAPASAEPAHPCRKRAKIQPVILMVITIIIITAAAMHTCNRVNVLYKTQYARTYNNLYMGTYTRCSWNIILRSTQSYKTYGLLLIIFSTRPVV